MLGLQRLTVSISIIYLSTAGQVFKNVRNGLTVSEQARMGRSKHQVSNQQWPLLAIVVIARTPTEESANTYNADGPAGNFPSQNPAFGCRISKAHNLRGNRPCRTPVYGGMVCVKSQVRPCCCLSDFGSTPTLGDLTIGPCKQLVLLSFPRSFRLQKERANQQDPKHQEADARIRSFVSRHSFVGVLVLLLDPSFLPFVQIPACFCLVVG